VLLAAQNDYRRVAAPVDTMLTTDGTLRNTALSGQVRAV
jgi:hypothetical protein